MNIPDEAVEAAARRPKPYDGMTAEDLRVLAILTNQSGNPTASIRFDEPKARFVSSEITEALRYHP